LAAEVVVRQAEEPLDGTGAVARLVLAQARLAQGFNADAASLLSEVDDWMLNNPPTSAPSYGELQARRADILAGLGQSERATETLRLALERYATADQLGHPGRARIQLALAELLVAAGDSATSRDLLAEAITTLDPILDPAALLRGQWQALGQRLDALESE
jgi:tetratricopeptide (TPR) repeat protein